MVEVSLRQHIIGLLSKSRYVREEQTDESVMALCKKLGVLPEMFWEARLVYVERVKHQQSRVDKPKNDGKSGSYSYAYVMLDQVPSQVLERWEVKAKQFGVKPPGLLRATMHSYLLSNHEIEPLSYELGWADLRLGALSGKRKIKANVTYASFGALKRRSEVLGVARFALVRALVKEVLKGNFGREGLKFVTRSQMFHEEDQYLRGFAETP